MVTRTWSSGADRALAGATAVEIFAAGEACAATETKSTRRRLSQRFRSVAQTPTDSASTMTSVCMRGLASGGPRSSKFSNDGGRGAVLLPPVRMIILPSCVLFALVCSSSSVGSEELF